jgi:hypothetical protein
MTEIKFLNRRAYQVENEQVRVTVLVEGGHVAEILHKASNTNPLVIFSKFSSQKRFHSVQNHLKTLFSGVLHGQQ